MGESPGSPKDYLSKLVSSTCNVDAALLNLGKLAGMFYSVYLYAKACDDWQPLRPEDVRVLCSFSSCPIMIRNHVAVVLRYVSLVQKKAFISLVTQKKQGTNTGAFLKSLKIKQIPSRRMRVRTIKQVCKDKRVVLTEHGKEIFGTMQKFYNAAGCASTLLIWSCQYMVLKNKEVLDTEEGGDVEVEWDEHEEKDCNE